MNILKLKEIYSDILTKSEKYRTRIGILSLTLLLSPAGFMFYAILTSEPNANIWGYCMLCIIAGIVNFLILETTSAERLKRKDKKYQEEIKNLENEINEFKSEMKHNVITNSYIDAAKIYQILKILQFNHVNENLFEEKFVQTLKEMVQLYNNHIQTTDTSELIEVTTHEYKENKLYFRESDLITALQSGLFSLYELMYSVKKCEEKSVFKGYIKYAITQENLNQLLDKKTNDKNYCAEQVSNFFMAIRGAYISKDNANIIKNILGDINYLMFMKNNTIEDCAVLSENKSIMSEIEAVIQNLNAQIDTMNSEQRAVYKALLADIQKGEELKVLHDSEILNMFKEKLLKIQEDISSEQYNNIEKFKRYLMKTR